MMELTPESALEGVRRSTCDHGTASTLAFVITDLLDSTAMSTANPAAFKEVQTAHDDVMRAGLKRFRGVELGTQGDSFEVVFTEVDHAVHFCVHVQLSLMEAQWSKAVLALPSCKAVRSRLFGNIVSALSSLLSTLCAVIVRLLLGSSSGKSPASGMTLIDDRTACRLCGSGG